MTQRCEVITWQRFYALARRLAHRVNESGYRPDLIVAIARGGYMPARILSDFLGQPDMDSFRIEHHRNAQKQAAALVRYPLAADIAGRRVLLVDDVSDSGETFAAALDHLHTRGAPAQLKTAVLHHKVVSRYAPDYYACKVIKWRWIVYPRAVAEDLRGFIAAMQPRPPDAEEVSRRLAADHGIRVAQSLLQEVMDMGDCLG